MTLTPGTRLIPDRSGAALALLTTSLILSGPATAEWDVDHLEELLPRAETPAEAAAREALQAAGHPLHRAVDADPPPTAPVRNCAEWEPCTGVLVRYPLGLPYALLRDLDDDVTLHVIVSSGFLSQAESNLAANGVDMDQVDFLVRSSDSIWTRDYGPWHVFDGNGDFLIIDHVYNRTFRPNDDMIPVHFGNQQGIPVVRHDMWHTGGNYMTDGAAISSSTKLVYNEAQSANGMSPAEVDALMADYYGVAIYNVLDYIESVGIHHIDTWAKFLDEETVLLKEVWSSHHTYDDLEQRATLLASLDSSTGRPYRVIRVYCHDIGGNDPASYTNSLIINRSIYVPTFGNTTHDANALAAYEEAAPGYTVRGYFYSGWLTDDALHCRAKGIMDRDMLRVEHVPVITDQVGDVTVQATVRDHSGTGVTLVAAYYRQEGAGLWEETAMTAIGGGVYEATIPSPTGPATTEYYIHAEDGSGRTEGMPRTEPAAWYAFNHLPVGVGVGDDALASVVTRVGPSHPNPARASTTFSFELHHPETVDLAVYDIAGRRVRQLVSGTAAGGRTEITWDGRDDAGRAVAPGVYRFVLRAAGLSYARPVVRVE